MTSPADASFDPLEASPSPSLAEHLQDVTEALAAARTQAEVLDVVLAPALQALGAVAGAVLLVDEAAGRHLRMAAHQGYVPGVKTLWQDGLVEDHGPAADVLRTREALYFEHAGELKVVYPDLEARTGAGAAVATAVLPMFLDGRPLGSLVLDFREPHTFTPQERRFLRTLASQGAVALGRADSLHLLERHLEERTRTILEDAQTQETFMAFTTAVGSETDLFTLIRQAITVLQGRFPGITAAYYEEEDGLWKARVWSDDMRPDLAAMIADGLPAQTPMFAQALQTRQPVFTDVWEAAREGVALSEEYGAAANYPLLVNGELHWMLSVGLRDTQRWSEADRGLVRAVGRGLNLALERTETARQLMLQNAELLARTRALETFAELTRDLALTTDPLLLIRRAQEVVMSMLSDGAALYYEPEGERWHNRVQHGTLHSPELQAAIDAGLPYAETTNLLIPWTSGQPYFQDVYAQDTDQLAPVVGHIGATATLPMRVGNTPLGVMAFALFQQRAWSSVDRVLLETAVQSLELALERAAQTRQLDEERAALEAFTRFTEEVRSETDVQSLVQRAITLLADTCGVDAVYLEREADLDLFQAVAWNARFDPALLSRLQAGFPLRQSNLALILREHTAAFIDHWDATAQWIEESAHLQAVAGYPLVQRDEMQSVMIIGSRTRATWTERDRGIFRAVGRSLDLALDRARQTRTVTAQRDALDARTQELSVANEDLEAFSYSISHDLRTPVRHMIGFLRLARSSLDGKLDERSARYMDVVEQAGTQMNALIDALLDLSRASQQPLRLTKVDLNAIMAQLQERLLPDLLTREIRWEMASMPPVWGDREALTQVMTQLTENALKFTRTRDPAVIKVWAEDQGNAWGVFVQDNGLGFDPRYQDRLFNMFQRLHSVQEATGTGVGLASVRRLILKHGGQVFAEGHVGEGATFGFSLPKRGTGLVPILRSLD
ncbi:GAF domain-containing protein [Deinococcus marmoris]|uniref:GAF domain-containing protein n=1 Tax=Deinococcus marmoris TaxID=249408 RepID=UPI0009DD8577|nr:GAF domain-containing protein [Deinococcus marmoris]